MSPEQLKAVTDLLNAMAGLVRVLGPWPSFAAIVVLVGGPLAYSVYRDHRVDRRVNRVVDEKEKEIVRLSEANRELRTTLLRIKGYPEHLLHADAEDSAKAKEKGKGKGGSK